MLTPVKSSQIEVIDFGTLSSGQKVSLYKLNAGSMSVVLCDLGASLVSCCVPDKYGMSRDVVLGFSTLEGYTKRHPYLGSTVGRFANRISGGQFSIGSQVYYLAKNNGNNHLHGGIHGFDLKLWKAECINNRADCVAVRFDYLSQDGEEGYPGELNASVEYTLSASGSLSLEYRAQCSKPCPVNLTNHSYFNLNGEGNGTILEHKATFKSSHYLPANAEQIPTGEIALVDGTAFDFRQCKTIGRDFDQLSSTQGYDFCFVIDNVTSKLQPFAQVFSQGSGIQLDVATTLPGFHFYTGNVLSKVEGKLGSLYDKHSGFCIETEFYPDSPNKPQFPRCIIGPGDEWKHTTVYSFSVIG